jgi:hypothetical protein
MCVCKANNNNNSRALVFSRSFHGGARSFV